MSVIEQHIVLQIVKGILKAPGDENSAEQVMDRVDLLDGNGLALATDGWSPKIASLKSGGVWAESTIAEGRRLLSGTDGNVTETMQAALGNPDLQQRHAILKRLNRIIQDCRDFWQTEYQIDPVYLVWHSAVGAGEQYALIYNVELDYQLDSFMLENPWDVTLTIEREPYWRGLPPGMNPKEWFLGDYSGRPRGNGYNVDNLKLYQDNDHMVVTTISNRHEWHPDTYVNTITQNWLQVDAEKIPGDAPALVCMTMAASTQKIRDLYIAKSTRPTLYTSRADTNQQRAPASMYAAGDAEVVTGGVSKITTSDGLISNGSAVQEYLMRFTFSTNPGEMLWGENLWDLNVIRGTHAVFLRCSNSGAADGDVELTLTFKGLPFGADTQTLTGTSIGTNTEGEWAWVYMGTVTIPGNARSASSLDGYGVESFPTAHPTANKVEQGYLCTLSAERVSGAANFAVLDLVLLPMDEALVDIVPGNGTTAAETLYHVYDNTGYFNHGQPGSIALLFDIDYAGLYGMTFGDSMEIRGPDLTLTPGVDNRLHFFLTNIPTGSPPTTLTDEDRTLTVRLNLVPRWRGIRDT